jgi:hypothetical protein
MDERSNFNVALPKNRDKIQVHTAKCITYTESYPMGISAYPRRYIKPRAYVMP